MLQTFNLFDGETQDVPAGAPGDKGRAARVARKLGASRLGMSIYELPPGAENGPYHIEWTDEEWLISLAGTVAFRGPDGDDQTLAPGDMVCFPAGPAGAHQIRNGGEGTARFAVLSSQSEPCIVEYPERERVGIWVGGDHYEVDRPSG